MFLTVYSNAKVNSNLDNLTLKNMPVFSGIRRLKVALGGFVSLAGMSVLACAFLTLSGNTDLSVVFGSTLSIILIATLGGFDVLCGLILILRGKEITLSVASEQQEANNNSD